MKHQTTADLPAEFQRRAIKSLLQSGAYNTREIARHLCVCETTASYHLHRMRASSFKLGRYRFWYLTADQLEAVKQRSAPEASSRKRADPGRLPINQRAS
jgi:hypothetical protein